MLIPIGHENMSARRWPIITSALILINVFAFLATRSALNKEGPELANLQIQILMLAAQHPELNIPPEVQPMIASFREHNEEEWTTIENQGNEMTDSIGLRLADDPAGLQEQMDAMAKEYSQLSESSIARQYAFVPAHPNPIAYLTANFLHGGWLHLIGNMWFLWLAGFVLEDIWGRSLYFIFYIIAGAAALQFHSLTNSGSLIPTLGASGAVAALMGAFLVRFPKMKIEMLWILGFFRTYRFHASAYWLLPLWLLTEILYGVLFGASTGVAHWAHVGGFLFGAVVALSVRFSGIERSLNAAIEKEISGVDDPEIARAQEYIDHKKLDEAVAVLQNYTAAKPAAIDAWNLLRDIHWQKQDFPAYQQTVMKCCALHLKARNDEAAWRDYEDYVSSGGKQMPLELRYDLCRLIESQGDFERAICEYKQLAAENPSDRKALIAQLAAGKICLKKLNRPEEALKFYEAAETSPVPHLDFEQTIQSAMLEAKTALSVKANWGQPP
jgi:membrane associated rhomboid family serine protease